MKNISVTSFIHVLFLLVLTILVAAFYYFKVATQDERRPRNVARYKPISDSFLFRRTIDTKDVKLKKFYNDYRIEPVSIKDVYPEIEQSGKTIFESTTIYGRFRVFKTTQNRYIYVQRPDYTQMFIDNQLSYYEEIYRTIVIISAVIGILFIIMYIMILRKLIPLKKLHKQIEQFAAGDLDTKIEYQGNDEIGAIAHSFNKAIGHIKQLMSSKNLFMRNIMHELKTPITKGRIISETIDDDVSKKFLISAFDRMNELITDLADVERITMYNFEPTKEDTWLSDVIRRTEDVLMADKQKYDIKIIDRPLYTDIKLLSIVLKNLLDNGIKYSADGHVTLSSIGNKLEIRSKGKKLKEKLNFYVEPFSQNEKRSSGFGLGLYIVNNILEKLENEFQYHYDTKKKENVFSIIIN